MARTSLQLRIHGAENARGNVIRFRTTTHEKINTVLSDELPAAVDRMRAVMFARFNSPDSSGRTAGSLKGIIDQNSDGATVSISITNFRHVKYMTSLVPDSEFMAGPYPIVAHRGKMVFNWRRVGRRVALKSVVHPGFGPDDILAIVGENELSRLGYLVEYTVRSAVGEVTSGERTLRVSGRR